jgi:AcrR family transcriptional regulator
MHGHNQPHHRPSSHRPTKADVITEYRRNALLHAAVQVFGEHGFDCATMEQIAQRADVAKGTTYLYYRSKQSIYDAALSHGLAELDERTRDAIDRAPSLRDAIPAFVNARAEYFLEHRDFFRMYVAAVARQITSAKPRASEFQALMDRQIARLEEAVARAVARREIRHVDAASAAQAIFDLTRGFAARAVMSDTGFDLPRETAFVSALVWKGLTREKGKGTRESACGPSEGPEGSDAKRRPRARASGGGAPRAVKKADRYSAG